MSEPTAKTVFEVEMDVRWGDMDAFNHVNDRGSPPKSVL